MSNSQSENVTRQGTISVEDYAGKTRIFHVVRIPLGSQAAWLAEEENGYYRAEVIMDSETTPTEALDQLTQRLEDVVTTTTFHTDGNSIHKNSIGHFIKEKGNLTIAVDEHGNHAGVTHE